MVRKEYDKQCKILRQLESQELNNRIYKTRAVVKDLHSRIIVAIQRIDLISKRIEELRDRELQPQLEELIEGYVLISVIVLGQKHDRCCVYESQETCVIILLEDMFPFSRFICFTFEYFQIKTDVGGDV